MKATQAIEDSKMLMRDATISPAAVFGWSGDMVAERAQQDR